MEGISEIQHSSLYIDPQTETDFSEEYSSDEMLETWIRWFLSKKENKYLLQVPDNYIQDDFNLTELPSIVPHFREARALITDDDSDETYDLEQLTASPEIQRSAHLLYYLIHQRYLVTSQGMEEMSRKYIAGYFGICPRTLCDDSRVIPIGLSDAPGQHAFKLFCPCCVDVYVPTEPKFHVVDGCAWGTTYAHMFFMRFPEFAMANLDDNASNENVDINQLAASISNANDEDEEEFVGLEKIKIAGKVVRVYEPKIFGFKIHSSSPVALNHSELRIRSNHVSYLGL